MKRYAPLLTLVAVAVLGVALLVVNSLSNPAGRQDVAAAAPTTTAAPPRPTVAEPTVEPPAIAEQAYTGRSSGNEVTVAVAVKDGRAVAYVCDGERIEAWLEGTLEGDRLSLQGADGAGITGTVDDAKALGTVAVAGRQWPYAAKAVQAPAGLYEGRANIDGVAVRIGWVVEDDDGELTVTGVAETASGVTSPAPPLNPSEPDDVEINGVVVTVDEIGGGDEVIPR